MNRHSVHRLEGGMPDTLIVTQWCHMTTFIWVTIDSGNGFIVWQHKATTQNNVAISSMRFCRIHARKKIARSATSPMGQLVKKAIVHGEWPMGHRPVFTDNHDDRHICRKPDLWQVRLGDITNGDNWYVGNALLLGSSYTDIGHRTGISDYISPFSAKRSHSFISAVPNAGLVLVPPYIVI